MLLQSHEETGDRGQETGFVLRLLPALPSAWPSGRVTGLRARGGFEVDMTWANGALASVTLRSVGGKVCRVEYVGKACAVNLSPGQATTLNGNLQASEPAAVVPADDSKSLLSLLLAGSEVYQLAQAKAQNHVQRLTFR
jgi:hypothetical protein